VKPNREALCLGGFFLLALIVGLAAAPRYGVSWDEPNMMGLGISGLNYVLGRGEWPQTTLERFHGPLVEIALAAAQQLAGVETPRSAFVLRHVLTYLIFLGGLAAFYALARRTLGDWTLALFGMAMLLLSPRIFPHAFYNSRDIPNLALVTWSMLTLSRLVDSPSWSRTIVHGIATAAAVSVRIMSIVVIPITVIVLAARFRKRSLATLGVYLAAVAAFTYLFWPLLWAAPVRNSVAVLRDAAFDPSHRMDVYYFGRIRQAPWHYLPVWIVISTPLLYVVLFLAGLVPSIRNRLWIPLLWFFLPTALVMIARVTLYDSWRHMYFVYPAMILIALAGLQALPRRILWVSALLISFAWTGSWMWRNHPLQDVYFSLPGLAVRDGMERDYWGLSFKEGLLYLLRTDSGKIGVTVTSPAGRYASWTLSREDFERVELRYPPDEYVLDNLRSTNYESTLPADKLIHEIVVGGLPVLKIYDVR
jgi:hypothetical protein